MKDNLVIGERSLTAVCFGMVSAPTEHNSYAGDLQSQIHDEHHKCVLYPRLENSDAMHQTSAAGYAKQGRKRIGVSALYPFLMILLGQLTE